MLAKLLYQPAIVGTTAYLKVGLGSVPKNSYSREEVLQCAQRGLGNTSTRSIKKYEHSKYFLTLYFQYKSLYFSLACMQAVLALSVRAPTTL